MRYLLSPHIHTVLRPRRVSVRERIASGRRPAKRRRWKRRRHQRREPGRHSGSQSPGHGGRADSGRQRSPVAAAPGPHTSDSTFADQRRGRHTDQARTVAVAQRAAQPDHHQSAVARRFK